MTLITILIMATTIEASTKIQPAVGDPYTEPIQIRCTCYTDTGTMATGSQTRHGVIAGSPEWFGSVAMLYEIDPDTGELGEWIGYYEVLDTGAGFDTDDDGLADSINRGQSIDVWCENDQEVNEWISEHGDYVYMKLVKGQG